MEDCEDKKEVEIEEKPLHTALLTIEIDEDDYLPPLPDFKPGTDPQLASQPKPKVPTKYNIIDYELELDSEMKIGNLYTNIIDIIQSHLEIPLISSMKNWESVAYSLSLSSDAIIALREDKSPMLTVLNRSMNRPVNDLFNAIREAERADTLESIANELQVAGQSNVIYERFDQQKNLAEPSKGKYDQFEQRRYSSASTVIAVESLQMTSMKCIPMTGADILITHFESTTEETKNFAWFMKNFRHQVDKTRTIKDINDLDAETSVTEGIKFHFEKAKHIIVMFNPSYLELINSDIHDEMETARHKKMLHSMMESEYLLKGCQNYRFRPVIISGTIVKELPSYWSNTRVYSFPSKDLFADLCKRVLRDEGVSENLMMSTR